MVGVDEVGRGCLAGPLLVVAARAKADLPPGLKDSKLLSRKHREDILDLLSICCEWGEGWVSSTEIDRHGLSKALRVGGARALRNLGAMADDKIVLDGSFNYIPKKYGHAMAVIKADNSVPIVSAASIIAKVKRDRFMIELSKKLDSYGFEKHVGYGTKAHMLALKRFGAVKYVHRQSFMPITKLSGV